VCSLQEIVGAGGPGAVLVENVVQQNPDYQSRMAHQSHWTSQVLQAFLSPDDVQQLTRLAIFPASFSVQAASQVAPGLARKQLQGLKVWNVLREASPLAGVRLE
jgi:hypothetical protein